MKAKVIVAAIAALLCVNVFAQTSEKSWRWTVEAESQAGGMRNAGVGATYGCQFNPRLYAGFGADCLYTIDDAGINAPVFVLAKVDMLKQQNTPIVDVRGGVAVHHGDFPYGYASVAFGYKFKGEKTVVCPTLGWAMQGEYSNSMVLRFAIEL